MQSTTSISDFAEPTEAVAEELAPNVYKVADEPRIRFALGGRFLRFFEYAVGLSAVMWLGAELAGAGLTGILSLVLRLGIVGAVFGSFTWRAFRGVGAEAAVARRIQGVGATLQQLTDELNHDPLAELKNRRYFEERLAEEIERSARYGHPVSTLLIDVDQFKLINDRHGHKVGDQVLKRLANHLRASIRNIDIAARFGGDEFVVLLPETNETDAGEVARRILERVEGGSLQAGGFSKFTVSIGVAGRHDHRSTPEAVLAVADRMMYKAKSMGGDSVQTAGKKLFGEWIAEKGIATVAQVDEALDYAQANSQPIGTALVQLGFATPEQIESIDVTLPGPLWVRVPRSPFHTHEPPGPRWQWREPCPVYTPLSYQP